MISCQEVLKSYQNRIVQINYWNNRGPACANKKQEENLAVLFCIREGKSRVLTILLKLGQIPLEPDTFRCPDAPD
jgi:hypothetical protein